MPTGYTGKLYRGDDLTLGEFILDCARAFVPEMRDRPMNEPIPEESSSWSTDYHERELQRSYDTLEGYRQMDLVEAGAQARKAWEKKLADDEEYLASRVALVTRYQEMLEQVIEWKPPTTDHDALKQFMIDQLTSSMKFDADVRWAEDRLNRHIEAGVPTPQQFTDHKIEQIESAIEFHKAELQKARETKANNDAWIVALHESVRNLETSV